MLQKVANKFNCKDCDYHTSRKSSWNKHISTHKHGILTNTDAFATKSCKLYKCECGKMYNHRASLYNHKRSCTFKKET